MKKELKISEIRAIYGDESYETETGYLVNKFGKYKPNITFVLPKIFDLGKDGEIIDPLDYTEDKAMTDDMNVDFDGDAGFIFGDFWRSKKGGACFKPKNPMKAEHLLIRVCWGGCFNSHRGLSRNEVEACRPLYYRSACSSGGGVGYDYIVLPVGFKKNGYDPEFDGDCKPAEINFKARAKEIREKYADLQKKEVDEADTYLKEKAAAEEKSAADREKHIARLTELQCELEELGKPKKFGNYGVAKIDIGDAYFKIECEKRLYNDENMEYAEKIVERQREWIRSEEARRQELADAKARFAPLYEGMRERATRIGWELKLEGEKAKVATPSDYYDTVYAYDIDGFTKFRQKLEAEENRIAEAEAKLRNEQRIEGILSQTELSKEIWFVFSGSEDSDDEIRSQAEAILRARAAEKDDMDEHELMYCGFERRTNAIQRVILRAGGRTLTCGLSQASSTKLARYLMERDD